MLIIAVLIAQQAISGEDTRTPLTVTYVANDGFIFECQDKKVVIDALFGGWESDEFYMPTDSTIELMKMAKPPFDNIDLIAVTHFHDDHFEPSIIMSHLKHDLRSVVVCTPQVAEKLAKDEGYSDIRGRIKPISAPIDSVVAINIGGIDVKVIPGKHGPYIETDEATGEKIDRHSGVQHLEYLISMCGRTIYHSGDAPLNDMERYRRLGFGRDNNRPGIDSGVHSSRDYKFQGETRQGSHQSREDYPHASSAGSKLFRTGAEENMRRKENNRTSSKHGEVDYSLAASP